MNKTSLQFLNKSNTLGILLIFFIEYRFISLIKLEWVKLHKKRISKVIIKIKVIKSQ